MLCTKCREEKPPTDFSKNHSKPNGVSGQCKVCMAQYQRAWYEANKAKHYQIVKKNRAEAVRKIHIVILEYLLQNPCVDCGESDPVVLQFDHVRGTKTAHVSKFVGDGDLEGALEEIAKCDVRCSNCHDRATAQRGNFWKVRLLAELVAGKA